MVVGRLEHGALKVGDAVSFRPGAVGGEARRGPRRLGEASSQVEEPCFGFLLGAPVVPFDQLFWGRVPLLK